MKTEKSEDKEHARPFVTGSGAGLGVGATVKYLNGKMPAGAQRLTILRSMGVGPTGVAARFMFESFAWFTDHCTSEGAICFVVGAFIAVLVRCWLVSFLINKDFFDTSFLRPMSRIRTQSSLHALSVKV